MNNDVITFGCRLNDAESEMIRNHLAHSGAQNTVVVNSCAVTSEAERQLRQSLRRLRRNRPDARIVLTGCAAQIRPEHYANMNEVDALMGNEEKLHRHAYSNLLKPETEKAQVNDIMSVKETAGHLVHGMTDKARAFIQIQNGCDHRCTFCIIPYGRGNSRSVPVGEVVNQVRQLVEHGYNEVVFTGVDVSAYGQDLPGEPVLGELCQRVLKLVPELPRLRLSSIDAIEIDPTLKKLFADEARLMPHVHLSLQAGDNMILKRMKRRHSREDAIALCNELKDLRPDIVFGADIIAGFPTETNEMFDNSLKLIEECELTYLHIFPYSEREGTPAAKMPPVPKQIRKERAAQLRQLGEQQLHAFLQRQIGQEVTLLMEKDNIGRTTQFAPAKLIQTDTVPLGTIVKARINGVSNNQLIAETQA